MPTISEYQTKLNQILSRRDVSSSALLGLIAQLQIEQANLLQAQITPVEPVPIVRTLKLDNTRAATNPERIDISGNYFSCYTDGIPQNIQIQFEKDNTLMDPVPISRFNNVRLPFDRFYLINDAQSGKTITFFIGKKNASAGSSGKPTWQVDEQKIAMSKALTDMGELAVRLGSIYSLDRQGDVIYMDDFESGNHWGSSFSASGEFCLSNSLPYMGNLSARLLPGYNLDDQGQMNIALPLPSLGKIGFLQFFSHDASNLKSISFYFDIYIFPTIYWYQITYDTTKPSISYLDQNNTLIEIASGPDVYTTNGIYYPLKLVVDTSQATYKRLVFNNKTYDLSGIKCYQTGAATAPYVYVRYIATLLNPVQSYFYIDNFVFTQNEV